MSKFNELMEIYAPWSTPIEDGAYPELSMRAYHEDMAVGSSAIKLLQDPAGGALYYEQYLSERRRPYSEGNDIGSIAHKMVLEPDDFDNQYRIAPEGLDNKAKKEWKDLELDASRINKTLIKHSEYQQVCAMRDAVMAHEIARNMLSKGFAEHSYFTTCPKTGVRMKARPDHVSPHPMIDGAFAGIDYKTTAIQNLGIKKWSYQEANLCRHIQAAHHRYVFEQATGKKMPDFYHIAQMQEAPYLVRVFRIPATWFTEGNVCIDVGKNTLMHSLENAQFDGYPVEVEDMIDPFNFNSDDF